MVRLISEANGREIAHHVRVAQTTLERMRGLLGRDGLAPGEGLLIERCSSIHTCFMKFPLDVIFLDSDRTVTKVIRDLRPWRLAMSPGASRVVELAAGALENVPLSRGDVLRMEEAP